MFFYFAKNSLSYLRPKKGLPQAQPAMKRYANRDKKQGSMSTPFSPSNRTILLV
jgi:hypothetical protein